MKFLVLVELVVILGVSGKVIPDSIVDEVVDLEASSLIPEKDSVDKDGDKDIEARVARQVPYFDGSYNPYEAPLSQRTAANMKWDLFKKILPCLLGTHDNQPPPPPPVYGIYPAPDLIDHKLHPDQLHSLLAWASQNLPPEIIQAFLQSSQSSAPLSRSNQNGLYDPMGYQLYNPNPHIPYHKSLLVDPNQFMKAAEMYNMANQYPNQMPNQFPVNTKDLSAQSIKDVLQKDKRESEDEEFADLKRLLESF